MVSIHKGAQKSGRPMALCANILSEINCLLNADSIACFAVAMVSIHKGAQKSGRPMAP